MSEELPTSIGRYQVQAELGRGGFGRVFRAYDPTVGRPVAIKVLTEGSKELLTRFRNEAAVAGNLRHKNIVTVYEFGEHNGRPFLAMEYLEGENLNHAITSRKPLTLLQKTSIMSQVAEGLYCAHRSGVVHRDVKPANIMLLLDGTVKIMDFGIARLTRDNEATRLTQQGYMLGTLLYMAPEQFAGAEIDVLCDIFAYGVIYYELLTGKHPFESPDARSLMFKISFEDPPPIRSLAPECPEALERVIRRLLHKERELRYQSLKEAQFDTEPVRIDLQQERAARLLVEAQELFDKKQLDPAQTVVLEALSLDPANKGARALYENLQKQLQQRVLQPRIEALLKSGEEQLSQRRFSDAVQSFESALRLDRENVFIQSRLEQARALAEHAKRAAQLLAEARMEFDRHNISAAFKDVDEALRLDPENPEAAALQRHLQDAIERRRRERRLEEAIGRAEGLLLQHSYDEALALLSSLEGGAESPKVQRLLDWVRTQKAEHERRQRLQGEMATATSLLKDHRFAEAVQRLEALQAEFPKQEEVAHLLQYARQGLAAQERARAIEKAAGETRALVENHDFEGALRLLDEALKTYPGESTLIRLLGNAMATKADWDRRQAIQGMLQKCEELRSQKRFAAAQEAAEAALRQYVGEPALQELLARIEKEWEEQKRAQAVAEALADARKLLGSQRPEKALELLRRAVARYPGEAELDSLLARAQQEQEALERARAIEAAAREAHAFAEKRDFGGALALLDRSLQTWPEEAVLVREREATLAAKAAWEREQAVAEAARRAREMARGQQFEDALRLIEGALAQYSGEAALLKARDEIGQAWERQKRIQAVARICDDARRAMRQERFQEAVRLLQDAATRYPGEAPLESLLAQAQDELRAQERAAAIEILVGEARTLAARNEFDRALELLEQGLRQWPGEAALVRLRESTGAAKAAWQRQQAIGEVARQATRLGEESRFNDALRLLETALARYPGETSLVALRAQLQAGWELQSRREAIAKAASEGTLLLDRGRLDEALRLLREATARFPGEREVAAVLEQAQQAIEARDRAAAIEKIAAEARARVEAHDFAAALAVLQSGLETYPGERSLLSLRKTALADQKRWEQEQARRRAAAIEKLAGEARAQAHAHQFDRAREILEQGLRTHPDEGSLLQARDELRAAQADWERKQAVEEARRRASALAGEGQLEAAIRVLQEALARWPAERDLEEPLARAQEELRARERAAAIAKLAAEAQAQSLAGDFEGALGLLDQALTTYPGEGALLTARESVSAAKAEWRHRQELEAERRRRREQDLAELRRIQEEASIAEPAQTAELLARARDLGARYAGDAEAAAAAGLAVQHLAAIQEARREFSNGNWPRVLEICREYLAREPDHLMFAELQAEAQQRQRAAAVEEVKRRAAAEINLESRARLLEEALRAYPGECSLEDEMGFTRNKLSLVQAIVEEARACEQGERWDEALERWNSLATIYPAYPGLAAETARAARCRDQARTAALARWSAQVESPLAAGDLARTAELLQRAQAEFPDAPELADLARRLQQARERKAKAQELLAHGREACQKGQYREGAGLLRQACDLDRGDPAVRKQALEIFAKSARQAVQAAWQDAQMLAGEARSLDPGWTIPGDLQRAIEDRKRDDIVSGCLHTAKQLQEGGRLQDAVNEIDRGLLAYPDEPRLQRPRETLAAELLGRRQRAAGELRAIAESGRGIPEVARIEALIANAREVAAQYPSDAEVQALAGEVARSLNARIRELRAAQLRARLAAYRNYILAGAAGLVVVIGAYLGVRALLRRPPALALEVVTSPAGAAVRIGKEMCAAPPCRFKLPPGSYSVETSLDGYAPVARKVTLDAAHPAPAALSLTLAPLRPAVQVSTNFASGGVRLDGKPAGSLRNGELTLNDVGFGRHELRVSGPDGEARVSFEASPGKPPVVAGAVEAKDLEAVLVSNLGAAARLDCNCGSQKVTLDGNAAGQTQPGGLELHGLARGTRTLKLGETAGQQDFVFSVGPAPSLSVFLNANRNVGTLVIESNVENAGVFINGRKYGATGRDLLRIPLDVNEYTVSVQKNGYENEAPQRAEIRKGGTTRLIFTLAQKNAALDIRAAVPDTQVSLDGKPVGTVANNGRFSYGNVKPGDHTIGLAKSGYVARQIQRRFEPGQPVSLGPEVTLAPDVRAQEEARQREEQVAWDRVNRNDRSSLEQFLAGYAKGRHAQEAKDALGKLDELDRQRAEAQRKAEQAKLERPKPEPPKPEPPKPEPPKVEPPKPDERALQQQRQLQADLLGIQAALTAYGQAVDSKNLPQLQAVYPVIPREERETFRQVFRDAQSIRTQLEMEGDAQITGDRAIASVQRTTTTVYPGRKSIPARQRVRFKLHRDRATGRWLIDAIEILR